MKPTGPKSKATRLTAGVATIAAGSQAYSATVISTNVVDYNIDLPTTAQFDIDGDGTDDFRIFATYGNTNSPGVSALNNAQFAIMAGSGYSIDSFAFPGINDVLDNTVLNVASVNGPSPGQAIVLGHYGTGLVPDGTSFIYGTLERAGNNHLFWVQLEIGDNTEYGNPAVNFLKAAAWNDIDTGSAGGDTLLTEAVPETSSAALLALGAVGMMSRRKRTK